MHNFSFCTKQAFCLIIYSSFIYLHLENNVCSPWYLCHTMRFHYYALSYILPLSNLSTLLRFDYFVPLYYICEYFEIECCPCRKLKYK